MRQCEKNTNFRVGNSETKLINSAQLQQTYQVFLMISGSEYLFIWNRVKDVKVCVSNKKTKAR